MFSPPDYSSKKNFLDPKLGPWTITLYLHRKPIITSLKKSITSLKGRVLDVGCGSKPYKEIINCDEYIGIDVGTTLHEKGVADEIFDGSHIPFEDESFDSIICTEVLEHCLDTTILMSEMSRVLKKGGHIFLSAPMFIQHHEIPYDLRRLTFYGINHLAKSNGLSIKWIDDRGNIFAVFVGSFHLLISQIISRRPFSDMFFWLFFPFCWLLLKLDKFKKKNPPVVSLGWQALLQK